MPYNKGEYGNVEKRIYDYLVNDLKLGVAAACGILGNIEEECEFNPNLLVDDLGKPAYGICQWRESRLARLRKRSGGVSKPNLERQLAYLKYELSGGDSGGPRFMNVNYPETAQGADLAGRNFSEFFERTANNPKYPGSLHSTRGANARDKYFPHYSGMNPTESSKAVSNIGKKIIEVAREIINTKPSIPYVWGKRSKEEGFDCSGFVYYCYNAAGVSYEYRTSSGCYEYYKDKAKVVSASETAAGDLLFYSNARQGIHHIAMANGEGGRVHAASSSTGIVEVDGLGNPTYILRILADSETSSGASSELTFDGMLPEEYLSLTINDPYSSDIAANLSRVEAVGYDYGYLIDITHGGEFKFYIPEFSEQAGANWGSVDIRGRSLQVLSYNHTNSRSVTVSLELYAGEGLYKPVGNETGGDALDRMHKDAFFLKSLEYPDYSNVIATPPSTVHLILGSAVSFIGVVSDVSVEHLKPLDPQNRSMHIKVNFKVTQIAGNPPDYKDIRNGQYSLISTSSTSTLQGKDIETSSNAPVYSEGGTN